MGRHSCGCGEALLTTTVLPVAEFDRKRRAAHDAAREVVGSTPRPRAACAASAGSWGSVTGWIGACILAVAGLVSTACGGSSSQLGTGGAGALRDGGVGGSAGGEVNTGGMSAGASDVGGLAGAFEGGDCMAIQQRAQQAADTSCSVDSDCERPPHMLGDCLECGAVTSVSSEQSSLAAVIAACQPFYAEGCTYPLHSCPAYQPKCNAGVCGD